MPVAQLAAGLRATYCGAVGYETMHITDKKRKDWLVARIEAPLADALQPWPLLLALLHLLGELCLRAV